MRRRERWLTCNKPVSLEILFIPLSQEDVSFIQQENAVPSVGKSKVKIQCFFDLLGRCTEITLSTVSVILFTGVRRFFIKNLPHVIWNNGLLNSSATPSE